MTSLLKVHKLNAWYGRAHILFDVGFEIGEGEVVALMGRNGAGKSTTMKAVMNLLSRTSGDITFMGDDISAWPTHRACGAGLCAGRLPRVRRSYCDGKSRHGPSIAAKRGADMDARKAF
ncbi:Branched-chain amino acid transport ATP-binding protein LivF [Candidatus Burkholderia pumila]|uniref:Branched-chain amino acid transport ATP-binding protein LivF n=1 Tax=Candidatus Burkholderia pumila TaxID=1090375 RepID=A0ABR5HMX4_9BURK|nr:Branched-chain amino acid transport ATP-binding protein LivF [Candidatus Burkholderia pumila]